MLGGASNRLRAYASSGTHRPVEQLVAMADRFATPAFQP